MGQEHDAARTSEVPAPAPAPVVAAPAPLAPVPLATGTITVGHAEDRAEADADARADTALARLRRTEADPHSHGPGCEHVRRSATVPSAAGTATGTAAGAPEVGREGGALGAETSAAIASRRGQGRRLDEPVLQRMQTAFGADLSSVRVHDDAASARLNRTVSARAFTTGKDIFFGGGEYAPDTAAGERVLAHELAHTLQPETPVQRLARLAAAAPVLRRTRTAWPEAGAAAQPAGAGPVTEDPVTDLVAGDKDSPGPEVGRLEAGAGPAGLSGLLAAKSAAMAKPLVTIADVLALTDADCAAISRSGGSKGKLMEMLKGPFKLDWNLAKECLVFEDWGTEQKPGFGRKSALALMTGLTTVRGHLHAELCAQVPGLLRNRIAEVAAKEKPGPRKAKLEQDAVSLSDKELIEFLGSVGADSVTSDVDVSTKGRYTEWGVQIYNATFRKDYKTEKDTGTVFDLNVYAKDFIFGFDMVDDAATPTERTMKIKPENATAISAVQAEHRDNDQEHWSLVHVARFMKDKSDWDAYRDQTLTGSEELRKRQVEKFQKAWVTAAQFRAEVLKMEATLAEAEAGLVGNGGGAATMRASNALYEEYLLVVKEIRDEIATFDPASTSDRLTHLVATLPGALSKAQLYANEVYGSGGATVHAVIGSQLRNKEQATENTKAKKDGTVARQIKVDMTPAQLFAAFNDNLGDVIKDYEHYGKKHGDKEPRLWWAAFKMGKYADRMVSTVDAMVGKGLPPAAAAEIQAMPAYVALAKLAVEHKTAKATIPDPLEIPKQNAYFEAIATAVPNGQGMVDDLRSQTLTLGGKVRGAFESNAFDPDAADLESHPEPVSAAPSGAGGAPFAGLVEGALELRSSLEQAPLPGAVNDELVVEDL